MKKKSIHKVSSTKKITPKPLKKKKSFSLRSWLLGSLVLIAALSYSLYQYNLQPKGIKVLEIPGTAFDYLVPSKATIYKIIEVDPGNAKNDLEAKVIDQLNKSANKVERLDKSNNNKQKEESLKELLEIGTAHKILNTYTDNNLSSVLDKDNNPTPEQQYEKLIKESKMKLAGNYYYENPLSFSNTNVNNNPASIAQGGQTVIGDGKGCGTSAFTVGSGETVIGAADKIYSCDNGIWSPVYLSDGITQCTKNDTDPLCRISVLPIYAGGKNCYNDGGATVLGDGSIQENGDGTASLCDGGKMVNNLVYYDGKWVTEDEKKIAEDKKKADEAAKKAQLAYNEKVCKKNGANWDGEVCRSSSESCASIGKDFDGKNCVDKKLTTKPDNKVVNPNGSKTGGELTTSVKDCIYGGTPTGRGDSRSAEFRCNDSTGKVPETKEECRA